MADFFKKLGQGISDTSKNISKSMADSKEKSSLRKKISEATSKISQAKIIIGNKIYEAYKNNSDIENFDEICREIDALYININTYNAELLKIEGFKICSKCSEKISADALFCPCCGTKQEDPPSPDEPIDVESDDITDINEDPTHIKL